MLTKTNVVARAVEESVNSGTPGRLMLRWFLSIALRIPTAHDFRVISARKLARARTDNERNFPQA